MIYASHKVWIIVDHLDHPMNDYSIFCNPSTTIQTYVTEKQALHAITIKGQKFGKSRFDKCRAVEATITWATHREDSNDSKVPKPNSQNRT